MVVLTAPLGLIGVTLGLLLFGKPFGFLTRAMGGIAVDRSNPSGLVAELTAQ